jgi:hypothetical protein
VEEPGSAFRVETGALLALVDELLTSYLSLCSAPPDTRRMEAADQRKCHNCGETGHLRRDCPSEMRESRKCHHCGQSGHLRRDCPDDSGPSEDKCYQCGETGHWARNCPGAKE